MSTANLPDRILQEQREMKRKLIPPRRHILASDTGFPRDKYEENDCTRKFLSEMNRLFNCMNVIRTWRQHDTPFPEFFLNCEKDYDEAIVLANGLYDKTPEDFRNPAKYYITDVVCRSMIRALACAQLRSECKPLYECSYDNLKDKIMKLSREMFSRPRCPNCQRYVKKMRKHVNKCAPPTKRILENERNHIVRNRKYFEIVSAIRYDEQCFSNLFS